MTSWIDVAVFSTPVQHLSFYSVLHPSDLKFNALLRFSQPVIHCYRLLLPTLFAIGSNANYGLILLPS